MKYFLVLLILLPHLLNCQVERACFFNEVFASVNRTNVRDSNTENKIGIGVGFNHIWRNEKQFNIGLGLEYNITKQYKRSILKTFGESIFDISYNINILSIPLFFRHSISITTNSYFFFEAGVYRDFVFGSVRKGKKSTNFIAEDGTVVHNEFEIKDSGGLYSNNGISLGLGMKFPCNGRKMATKFEYKYGPKSISENYTIYNRYFRLSFSFSIYK